jgi:hypothetical protein
VHVGGKARLLQLSFSKSLTSSRQRVCVSPGGVPSMSSVRGSSLSLSERLRLRDLLCRQQEMARATADRLQADEANRAANKEEQQDNDRHQMQRHYQQMQSTAASVVTATIVQAQEPRAAYSQMDYDLASHVFAVHPPPGQREASTEPAGTQQLVSSTGRQCPPSDPAFSCRVCSPRSQSSPERRSGRSPSRLHPTWLRRTFRAWSRSSVLAT